MADINGAKVSIINSSQLILISLLQKRVSNWHGNRKDKPGYHDHDEQVYDEDDTLETMFEHEHEHDPATCNECHA